MDQWSPSSWTAKIATQQPEWPDPGALKTALEELGGLPPLVFAGEARHLKTALAQAGSGEAFVLQAGDCAEAFGDFSADAIRDKLKIILQMAVVLTYGAGLPVVKIGRIAGQFAKPRSSPNEQIDGQELPSFRGHAVNDAAFDPASRRADPSRLVRAYNQSTATLNLIRAFTKGGFADLNQIHTWNQEFVAGSKQGRRYEVIAREIDRALRFMRACGIDLSADSKLHEVDFYISHEALLLGYEEALTRKDSLTGDWYDCSAHLLWVGDRTREPDGAHVEFLSGIHNPIACKVGPTATAADLDELCERLNPANEAGRMTFITRMGAGEVEGALPPLLAAMRDADRRVTWVCDPMHGNTFMSASGYKTRNFDDILTEIKSFFVAHQQERTIPGGVHLELTSDAVTECIDAEVTNETLELDYQALCDPRLNARQSLELAFQVGELLQT
ncbi:MAG: 3-deoxy-7-phosphoheptulonate synthase [Actinomycetota bacterium]|jgi:3-deoxy-7-phosphoheptulonate synthase|nr:3-deoxy-7-phosphoheptulonate synthase [Actinomycetota bacterium]